MLAVLILVASARPRKYPWCTLTPDKLCSSSGWCNTIWQNAVFKCGVNNSREAVWAFVGGEDRPVAALEGGRAMACDLAHLR